MALTAGTRLGLYEILAPIGAGGMGEVYRARDPRLGRTVAIKVLSDELSRDPEHLARFEREARLLAAVDHPNIAVIHGIETDGGRQFLVLEMIPGETLAERLAAGPLPVPQALGLAVQMADALAAAHDKGVIHRDFKPGNVRLTPDGRVKVLDFGLAKDLSDAAPAGSALATAPPSDTLPGSVLGTPAYMSPEQARGKPLDRRTDLWSFGCVLYEMLSGRKAFEGETTSDTLVAILERDPDWSALPGDTPPAVAGLLRRCLEKDRERRMRDARDARLELEDAARAPGREGRSERASSSRRPKGPGRWLRPFAGLFQRDAGPSDTSTPRPQPRLSQATFAEGLEDFPAWSPDGTRLAFAREEGTTRRIFVKDLAAGTESAVTSGAFDDIQPQWTSEGRRLVFTRSKERGRKLEPGDLFGQYQGADLWSIELSGARETRLVENAANPCPSPDGRRIAFDAQWAGPHRLWTVDPAGRNPEQVTTDASEGAVHLRPRWSPDGRRLVFTRMERTRFDVRVANLISKEQIAITNDPSQDVCPVWSPSGRFLYFSSYRSGGLNIWRIAVDPEGRPAGMLEQVTTGAGQDVEPAISPDGRRMAFSILRQNANVWKIPVDPAAGKPAGPPQKVTSSTREDSRASWSPDGRRVAFNSDRATDMNIWLCELSDRSLRQLTRGPGGDYQPRFTPDGSAIVFFSSRSGSADIWRVEVETGKLARLTKGPSIDVNPFVSPDGRHIAYMSDEGGRVEVWAMGPDGEDRRPLTETGVMGHFLAWTPRGELVYKSAAGKPAAMRVSPAGGDPEPLPEIAGASHMSFSPDGRRILDVVAHKALWVSPLEGGSPEKVFEFEDADVRIDYPVWSPDGRWVLFDRFRPQGGDIWLMERFE
ncbi:MAG: protein kinase [Acidobacteriota bacterium]|nr:protein kinase [Acidobacteriota bacterium]